MLLTKENASNYICCAAMHSMTVSNEENKQMPCCQGPLCTAWRWWMTQNEVVAGYCALARQPRAMDEKYLDYRG